MLPTWYICSEPIAVSIQQRHVIFTVRTIHELDSKTKIRIFGLPSGSVMDSVDDDPGFRGLSKRNVIKTRLWCTHAPVLIQHAL